MPNLEAQDRSPIEQKEFLCPICGFPLVPVSALSKEKIQYLQEVEIREQYYCRPCDSRYAIEQIWPQIDQSKIQSSKGDDL